MNYAIILSGGVGKRVGLETPKQYLMVNNKPVISYCLNTFQNHKDIDYILIIASREWQDFILDWVTKDKISKFIGFADAGESRKISAYNGILKLKNLGICDDSKILVHDAVRPCVSNNIINNILIGLDKYKAVFPAITVKDTTYLSNDGLIISNSLDRSKLRAGQTPESFIFKEYYAVHDKYKNELNNGDFDNLSEIGFMYKMGIEVGIVDGKESNYKITTIEDYNRFKFETENNI